MKTPRKFRLGSLKERVGDSSIPRNLQDVVWDLMGWMNSGWAMPGWAMPGLQDGAGTWEASGGVAGSEAARRAEWLWVWHHLSLPGGLVCPTPGWSEGFAAEAVADAVLNPIPSLEFAPSAEKWGGKSPPSRRTPFLLLPPNVTGFPTCRRPSLGRPLQKSGSSPSTTGPARLASSCSIQAA